MGAVLVFRDGSKERAAELALTYQAHLLANISDAVIATDSKLCLTAWNHAAERMLGWAPEEVLGRSIAAVLPIHESSVEVLRTPAGLLHALSGAEHADRPLPILLPDGGTIQVEGRAVELCDDGGQITGFDLVFCDLMMPELTGMDFHEELARAAPELVAKTVFLTAGAFTSKAQAFLENGDIPRLEKPFDAQVLRAMVTRMLP